MSKCPHPYSPCENVHAGVRTAAFVVAAVELPFPVQNRFKVLALYACDQAVASACRSPAKTQRQLGYLGRKKESVLIYNGGESSVMTPRTLLLGLPPSPSS